MVVSGIFVPEFQQQQVWGVLIALYLWLGGLGGAAMVAGTYGYFTRNRKKFMVLGAGIGFVSLVIGIIMLVADLTNPGNAYQVLISPQLNWSSWIAIGTWLIVLFIIFTGIIIAPFTGIPGLKNLGYKDNDKVLKALSFIASALGFLVTLYTGLLLAVVKAIPFWHNAALPLLFVVSAAATGVAALAITSRFVGETEVSEYLVSKVDYLITITEVVLVFIYLLVAYHGTVAEVLSVKEIVKGNLALPFWGGFLLLGVLIPLIIEKGVKNGRTLMLAAFFVIIGAIFLRYAILKAGYWELPF